MDFAAIRHRLVLPDECFGDDDDDAPVDAATVPDDAEPLLLVSNPKSGAKKGEKLLSGARQLLRAEQVIDLAAAGEPQRTLRRFVACANARIIVAGGDGTVGWIMAELDRLPPPRPAWPIAVIPLGTGNDCARVLGWLSTPFSASAAASSTHALSGLLTCAAAAPVQALDRWRIRFELDQPNDGANDDEEAAAAATAAAAAATTAAEQKKEKEKTISAPLCAEVDEDAGRMHLPMNNYFSCGADAHATYLFHTKRESSPHLFSGRFVNQAWYVQSGMKSMLQRCGLPSGRRFAQLMQLEVDGARVDIGDAIQGIIITNLRSYAGAVDLFGDVADDGLWQPPRHDDALLEVVGIRSLTSFGAFQAGERARKGTRVNAPRRLAQGSAVELRFAAQMACQVDGEPFMCAPGQLRFSIRQRQRVCTYDLDDVAS